MADNRTIEILMATHNGERFLREQIDSIRTQTDPDWRLTVSDDGSADGTEEILRAYAEREPERITRYVSGRRFGNPRDHFLHLIRHCGAEWMMLCDQDDTWFPEKIAVFREAMEAAEAQYGKEMPLLVFSDQVPADERLRPLADSLMTYQKQNTASFDYRAILMQNVVTGGAMALNRPLALLSGECADPSRMIMHDWWMAAVAARFGQIIYIDKPTGTYRQHGGNDTGAKHFGSAAYTKDRMEKLAEVRASILKKKAQAAVFRETYESRLAEEDLRFLKGFEKPRSGPAFYLKYGKWIYRPERKLGMMMLG